jgi:hypothetical protein
MGGRKFEMMQNEIDWKNKGVARKSSSDAL